MATLNKKGGTGSRFTQRLGKKEGKGKGFYQFLYVIAPSPTKNAARERNREEADDAEAVRASAKAARDAEKKALDIENKRGDGLRNQLADLRNVAQTLPFESTRPSEYSRYTKR